MIKKHSFNILAFFAHFHNFHVAQSTRARFVPLRCASFITSAQGLKIQCIRGKKVKAFLCILIKDRNSE